MRNTLLFAVSLLLAPSAAEGQSPFSLELGAGVAVPVQDFGNAELGTGFGFGANVRYRFQPHLAAYFGWEMHTFSADLARDELDVQQTGFALGLRCDRPPGAERPVQKQQIGRSQQRREVGRELRGRAFVRERAFDHGHGASRTTSLRGSRRLPAKPVASVVSSGTLKSASAWGK